MKKIIILLLNICLCIIAGTTSIYAWYTNYFGIKTTDDKLLSSNSSYFDSGEGTKDSPYIIANARHLYNLAWLQDLGYFDDFNPATTDVKEPFYFEIKNDITSIDMSQLKLGTNAPSPIPPIGIDNHPFISNFNGNGKTINNLIIDTNFSGNTYIKPSSDVLSAHTETIEGNVIKTTGIGTFGIIGEKRASGSTEKKAEYVQNFYLDNTIIKSSITASVGVVAGIVNSNIKQIGVHYSSIQLNGATPITGQKISDFSLIGKYDTDNGNWADRAGMVENFIFDADKIGNHGDVLESNVDYNDTNKNHTAYKREVFNLIGEMKIISIADEVNRGFTQSYEYDGQQYTYTASSEVKSIQFQNGFDGGNLRTNRQLRFHADGKGKIFFAVAGNGGTKTIEVYKSNTIDTNFTSVNGAHVLTADDVSKFTALSTKIESTENPYELKWGAIEITEKGDYVFVSRGGNAYLAYLHFIIANNQGNTGGVNAAYSIDKVDFIYLDPTTRQFIPFDENYKSSFVSFEIISGSGNIYFRRKKDSDTSDKDVVLFYPNNDASSSVNFNYYSTGNKGLATDETCEHLSGNIITGGTGGGGGSGPVATKFTITFNSQQGSSVSSQSIASGGKVTKPTDPTRDGYTFGGWYKESACTTAWNFNTDVVTENTTLYAKWTSTSSSTTATIYDFSTGIPTDSGITYKGSTSTSKGTVQYEGKPYDTCLKIESGTSITIKTTYDCKITLVFGSSASGKKILVGGTEKTLDSDGNITLDIKSGTTYTITKKDSINLFLIVVEK